MTVRTAALSQRHCGLPDGCSTTPMCSFGGVTAHDKVPDKLVEKIQKGLSPAWACYCSIRVIIPRYSAR